MNLKITGLKVDMQGEGSRGGHIIGHTGGGKPIYQNANHPSHKEFSSNDHLSAVNSHLARARTGVGAEFHYKQMLIHYKEAVDKQSGRKVPLSHENPPAMPAGPFAKG